MKRNVQYVMLGAGVTVLVFLGAFALLLSRAQADGAPGPVSSSPAGDSPHDVTTATGQSNEAAAPPPANDDAPAPVAENPTQLPGTPDDPETDTNVIVHTVTELAQRQEASLLGQTGWLHLESEWYIPEEQRGNGYRSPSSEEALPMETLVPASPIHEAWYHVDPIGRYDKAMGLIRTPEGTIHQQTLFMDSHWINLTLKTAGFRREEYEFEDPASQQVPLPTSGIVHMIEKAVPLNDVNVRAYEESGRYIVIVEQRYAETIDNAVFMPEPVAGNRSTYVFDSATGQILSREAEALLESGDKLVTEREVYLTAEFVLELPATATALFDDAERLLQEEN